MKETYDFRLSTKYALSLLGPNQAPISGSRPGFEVFKAEGVVGDPQYLKMESADRELAQLGIRSPIAGWGITRSYTRSEIEQGKLFLLSLSVVDTAGEEYGTWYTDGVLSENCAYERKVLVGIETKPFKQVYENRDEVRCALSSHQVGPLRIPFRKLKKHWDICSTWAGELAVTERLAKLIQTGRFTGCKLPRIANLSINPKAEPDFSNVPSGRELLDRAERTRLKPSDKGFWQWIEEEEQLPLLDKTLWEIADREMSRRESSPEETNYSELIVQSKPLNVADKTLFGETPFRPGEGERCKCSYGEVRGKRLLTHLSVLGSSWDGSDICFGDAFWNGRRGLFRPWRLLVVSKRLLEAMLEKNITGFDYEIVELV